MTRKIGRRIMKAVAAVLLVPLLYLLAVALGGVLSANADWEEAEEGVTIFIRTNGVHTWIMVPTVNADADWRRLADASHIRDPRLAGDYLAIGFGNRDFYLNTPTWADLTVRNAFGAFIGGGRTLLHVEHVHQPRPAEWQRPITLSVAQYRRLADYIRRRFQLDSEGRPMPLIGRGYNDWDMFYEANGGYSFVLTCNEWTGRALRHAGIRTGLWTPLEQSIMWRLD